MQGVARDRLTLGSPASPTHGAVPAALSHTLCLQRCSATRCDVSQPNAVQDLIMPLGCPTVLANYDEGVGLSMATRAVHSPMPCTAGVQ